MSSSRRSSSSTSPSQPVSSRLPLATTGTSKSSVARSASTSTLPSIRSLRKAFQFTNSSKSSDGYVHAPSGIGSSATSSTTANVLRKSNSSATPSTSRSSIGYNPLAHIRNSSQFGSRSSSVGNNTITKSSSVNDIAAQAGAAGAVAEAARSASSSGALSPSDSGSTSKNAGEGSGTSFQYSPPLPSPPPRTIVYNSSIPVNSRPVSTVSTPKSTPSLLEQTAASRASPRSIGDITRISEQVRKRGGRGEGEVASSPTTSTLASIGSGNGSELDNDNDMPVMHIKRTSPTTPPPSVPLPDVPQSSSLDQDTQSNSKDDDGKRDSLTIHARPSNLTSDTPWPPRVQSPVEKRYSLRSPSIDGILTLSSPRLLMHEMAPDSLNSVGDLSLASPSRPLMTRSRSAIESIRAMAEEADYLRSGEAAAAGTEDYSGAGSAVAGASAGPRSRQSSLPKPIIMESPSRSPAVMELGSVFQFPPSSSAGSGMASVAEFGDMGVHATALSPFSNVNDESGKEAPSMEGDSMGASRNREDSLDSGNSLNNSASTGSAGDTQAYVRRLRHSSTSPLTELVVRLASQANSPSGADLDNPDLIEFSRSTSSLAHEMDTSDLRSEEDAMSEMQDGSRRSGDSPFISQGMLEDTSGPTEDREGNQIDSSADLSSAREKVESDSAPPLRAGTETVKSVNEGQKRSFEKLGGRKLVQDRLSQYSSEDGSKTQLRGDLGNKISPQTEKRWSMAEVEAAYGRIRQLANRRTSAAVSETPSLIISEDSRDMEHSYLRHILENGYPLDASMTSSASHGTPRPSGVGARSISNSNLPRTNGGTSNAHDVIADEEKEGEDALTPLIGVERYSPVASPRLSPRSLSPHAFQQPSQNATRQFGRPNLDGHRADSPYSSGTASTSHGKSNGSVALTAPTSARLSQEELEKPPFANLASRRSSSEHSINDRRNTKTKVPAWYRRASIEASISGGSSAVGSDDTGWMTPKTSAGDPDQRRRSVSPKLAAARRSSIAAPEHPDDTVLPHHLRRGSTATRHVRPVSYGSSINTEGMPTSSSGGGTNSVRSSSFRNTIGPQHSISQSNLWFDDTPKPSHRTRPELPHDFRSSYAHPHRREASSFSEAGSTYSMTSNGTVSFAEAKRSDKIELFLRCTKAESALQAITMQSQIEKDALLDALQESRNAIDGLRQQTEELGELLSQARRSSVRRQTDQSQETARRITEMVEARDEWQRRAQAAERDLAKAESLHKERTTKAEATIASLRSRVAQLEEQLATARTPRVGSQITPIANARQGSGLPRRVSPGTSPKGPSQLPRASTGQLRNSVSGLPRSRHSSGTGSTGSPRHGRAISNNSSTFQTDFGDHLPASSDGWSIGDSQDASLRLDDSTAKYLQDIEGQSIRTRQKSATSSV